MGIYVITGATSGIGAKTAEILRSRGHEVVNVDLKGGDINANLATKDGRAAALAELHDRCPEGIDALICNAGVSGRQRPHPAHHLAQLLRRHRNGARGVRPA